MPWPQPPPLPEADVTVKAANANTALPLVQAAVSEATVIVPMQRTPLVRTAAVVNEPLTSETTRDGATTRVNSEVIDVTLSRETATFSVPVSEAQLPQSLNAALAKALTSEPVTATEIAAATIDQPAEREDLFPVHSDSQFTEQDLALIGRMAPQAAE